MVDRYLFKQISVDINVLVLFVPKDKFSLEMDPHCQIAENHPSFKATIAANTPEAYNAILALWKCVTHSALECGAETQTVRDDPDINTLAVKRPQLMT